MSVDAISLEVFRRLFASIAEEMGAVLGRTAWSPNIKERRDYSCAVFDATGRILAQAEHIPVHLGAMPASVQAAIKRFDSFEQGDLIALNDPYLGGTHLPDLTLISPVFMPDATLRQAVAAALGLGPYEAVGAQAMSALRSLDLRGAGVSDLTGLEYAVNLTGLDLSGNPVADLTPLGLLVNLRVLGLAGVEADPWPLFTLTGLRRLSLRDAGLSDISMLSGLTELEVLDLSGNPVSDLWPLAGMHRLGALRLDGGAVDLSPLAGLGSLGTLEVGGAAPARPAPTPGADPDRK